MSAKSDEQNSQLITPGDGQAEYPTAGFTERVAEGALEKLLPGALDRILPKKLEGPPYYIDVLSSVCAGNEHAIVFAITNNSRSGLCLETIELVRPDDKQATIQFAATERDPVTGSSVEIDPKIVFDDFPGVLLKQNSRFSFHLRFSRKDQNDLQNDPHGILRLRLSPLNEKKVVPVDVPFIIRWRS